MGRSTDAQRGILEEVPVRKFAEQFYSSKAWQKCRTSYVKSVGGLCERCLKQGLYRPAEIVHHKEWLTPENIHDPRITMAWSNLEALCRECHEAEHSDANKKAKHRKARRYTVDENGRVRTIKEQGEMP